MRKFLILAVVVCGASLVAASCSSDDSSTTTTTSKESPSKTTSGSSDSKSSGSKSFSVETPEGQVSLSLDGELPPNWPKDFPAPKQSKVAGSGSLAGESSGVMVGVYTSRESASDVFDSYKSNTDLKPSDAKSLSPGSAFLGRMKIGGAYDGSITVTSVDGTTYVVVVLKGGGGSASTSSSTSSSTTSTAVTSTTTGSSTTAAAG